MSVGQYLLHYAETETQMVSVSDNCNKTYYESILTIPAFNESESFLNRLKQISTPGALLIILVLNAPDDLASASKLINTQALGEKLKKDCDLLEEFSPTINLLALSSAPTRHVLLVERCQEGNFIPAQEGVGLARKIACDIACKYIAAGRINSHWIHTTDADVSLPKNYFEAINTLSPIEVVAALYPFQHTINADAHLNLCQQLYDISLHYYVEGLRWANSIYAYHTIGSTLLINFHAYALVRGFPKRAAGEDFYLLNKMAKTGEIVSLEQPVISIDSRKSDRVPFGTGPALSKIAQLENPAKDYLYYNPLCFEYLKTWLALLPALWNEKASTLSLPLLESLVDSPSDKIQLELLLRCLQNLGIEKALSHALKNSTTPENFLRHLHNWFDGFRTLKFIHGVRDALIQVGKPSVNVTKVLLQAEFLSDDVKGMINSINRKS